MQSEVSEENCCVIQWMIVWSSHDLDDIFFAEVNGLQTYRFTHAVTIELDFTLVRYWCGVCEPWRPGLALCSQMVAFFMLQTNAT